MWVAAFARHGGEFDAAGRAKPAVLETASEMAEVIAIAGAQIAIDDQLAALLTIGPNLPIVKT